MMKRILFTLLIAGFFLIVPCEGLEAASFQSAFGAREWDINWNPDLDLNSDGIIDGIDLAWSQLDPVNRNGRLIPAIYRMDHVLVKFEVEQPLNSMNGVLDGYNSRIVQGIDSGGTGFFRAELPSGESVTGFVARLKENPRIADAQPNYICSKSDFPNDTYYGRQWNFDAISVEKGWELTQGGDKDTVVAILDSGIAYENFEDYIQASDLAQTHFVPGYDFINSDDHPNDDEGHGTHVSGTVAQSTNNNIGVAGVAYRCALMPVKVLNNKGNGTSDSLAKGLRFAADNGAAVVNMSLGFPLGVDGGPAVRDAVTYAMTKDVICVGASGNEANTSGYDGGVDYPAALPGCIAVGGTRYDGNLAYYSNWGPELDCVAPGGDIGRDQNKDGQPDGILQQTFVNGNYTNIGFYYFQGTSMSTPHVAAAAALFKARHGGSLAAFRTALQETCQDLGDPGRDDRFGYGMIDLEGIVKKGTGWGADGW